MANYTFGDILLLRFPYTDQKNFKKRPALVITDTADGDIVVARITSRSKATIFDIQIKHWKKSGLLLPSIIRLHKLATLDKSMIESKLGRLVSEDKEKVLTIFPKLLPGKQSAKTAL